MPQPKSNRSQQGRRKASGAKTKRSSPAARKSSGASASASGAAKGKKRTGAKAGAAKGTGSARSSARPRRSSAGERTPTAPQSTARTRATADDAQSSASQGGSDVREALARGAQASLNLVMLSRERIQDTVDDAVQRGRMTRHDAEELVAELVRRGRKQTEDFLSDVEQIAGLGPRVLESAASDARQRVTQTASRARNLPPADRVLREADRARRTVGVGTSFPVLGYDDLTAAQVGDRLDTLTPPELRKVRDYERKHANRKSVLGAIEKALEK